MEPATAAYYGKDQRSTGRHLVQGGGYSMTLPFVDTHRNDITGFLSVSDDEATQATRALAASECIFAGYSSGANAAAALQLLHATTKPIQVLINVVDSGLKYMSTDLWDAP